MYSDTRCPEQPSIDQSICRVRPRSKPALGTTGAYPRPRAPGNRVEEVTDVKPDATWCSGWRGWPSTALGVATVSLLLSVMEFPEARLGVVINILIIAALAAGRRARPDLIGGCAARQAHT